MRRVTRYSFQGFPAIAINGLQGAGKSAKAIKIAKSHGMYAVISEWDFFNNVLKLSHVCANNTVVIVEDVNIRKQRKSKLQWIMSIIGSNTMECVRPMKGPITIKTPKFIFVATADKPFNVPKKNRRILIINVVKREKKSG